MLVSFGLYFICYDIICDIQRGISSSFLLLGLCEGVMDLVIAV